MICGLCHTSIDTPDFRRATNDNFEEVDAHPEGQCEGASPTTKYVPLKVNGH